MEKKGKKKNGKIKVSVNKMKGYINQNKKKENGK